MRLGLGSFFIKVFFSDWNSLTEIFVQAQTCNLPWPLTLAFSSFSYDTWISASEVEAAVEDPPTPEKPRKVFFTTTVVFVVVVFQASRSTKEIWISLFQFESCKSKWNSMYFNLNPCSIFAVKNSLFYSLNIFWKGFQVSSYNYACDSLLYYTSLSADVSLIATVNQATELILAPPWTANPLQPQSLYHV